MRTCKRRGECEHVAFQVGHHVLNAIDGLERVPVPVGRRAMDGVVRWATVVAEHLVEEVKWLSKEILKWIRRESAMAVPSGSRALSVGPRRIWLLLRLWGRPHTMCIIEAPVLGVLEHLIGVADLGTCSWVACANGVDAYQAKFLLCIEFFRGGETSG